MIWAWLLGGAVILALSAGVSNYFAWALFAYMGLWAAFAWRFCRCPKCKKPIWINYGLSMPYAPRKCSKCGYDLTA